MAPFPFSDFVLNTSILVDIVRPFPMVLACHDYLLGTSRVRSPRRCHDAFRLLFSLSTDPSYQTLCQPGPARLRSTP